MLRRHVWMGVSAIVAMALYVACAPAQESAPDSAPDMAGAESVPFEKGGSEETGHYQVDPSWPKPIHPDWTWGRTGGVWAESPDRIYVVQTGEIPVATRNAGGNPPKMHAVDHPDTRITEHRFLVFDGEGDLIDSWDVVNDLFVHPHSVKMSPYDPDHVWVMDGRSPSGEAAHQLWKFTREGELVMTLGEHKVEGNDETHFGGPTDLAFLPNGDFLVADGYRNSRIVRFDKDGNYLSQIGGTRGNAPGEFNTIHGIAVDADGRIYAADRSNSRIQIFDQSGELLDIWPNIPMPMDIAVTDDGHVWVADGQVNKFLKFDMQGRLLYAWGTFGGSEPGRVWGTHRMSVDSDGNFYTADVWGGRAQKFVPKPNADPAKLVGQFFGFAK